MDARRHSTSMRMDIIHDDNDFLRMPRQFLIDLYKNAVAHIGQLEAKADQATFYSEYKEADHIIKKLMMKEKYLTAKLAIKEKEVKDNKVHYKALEKSIQRDLISSINCSLQDPSANLLVQKLYQELNTTKTKLHEKECELNTVKFTPDSNIGKNLVAKCHMLRQENIALCKQINSDRISKLEDELMLQKDFVQEFKKSQLEVDSYLEAMDEDAINLDSLIVSLRRDILHYKNLLQKTLSEEKTDSNTVDVTKSDAMGSTINTPSVSKEKTDSKTVNGTKRDANGSTTNTPSVSKEKTDSKTVNGTKRDASGSIINTPSASKIETPTLLVKSKPESKSCKQDKSNDKTSTNLNDNKSNPLAEGTDHSKKSDITNKRQCESNHHKIEEKYKKGENMACSSGELIHTKTTQNN